MEMHVTIPASEFNELTAEINTMNRRAEAHNRERKKHHFDRVYRFPIRHTDTSVTVAVKFKNRRVVLWQELSGILEKYR